MIKLTTKQVRNTFIDFFKNTGHQHVQSSSLIPHNDPSLMFVNSGMVQFKDVFTGVEQRDYTRATSCQKAVRAGGKHNDLDNVGYTARHHTFFEMLGNFSFGDYFKEEAIYYAWNLLTKDFGLPIEKLYVTVYHNDEEAVSYWKKIAGLNDSRIIRINNSDNFWSMGDTGPCGPSTEIFYDHGEHIAGGLPGTPEQDGDRFIEIWNLVFMQYEQIDKNNRIKLPKQSVDTGMGLERISAVIQGVHDNYDIDLFQEIIHYSESILKVAAKGEALFSYRIIADHLRSSAFLIADGVMPANEGRGYVLRRIMRRAMRHIHQLGAKEPIMYKLLPKLIDLFGDTYRELVRTKEFVASILKQEEERFQLTLDRGLKLLQEESQLIDKGGILPGAVAFKLYDTYGFPIDLTEDILKKRNVTVDSQGFQQQMNLQKERARKAWTGSGELKTDAIWFDHLSEFGATEFLGYVLDQAEGCVQALIQNGKKFTNWNAKGGQFTMITNQTPFYGESGGQMGDIGTISSANCTIQVVNTLKFLGQIIGHVCELKEGSIKVGDEIKLSIDSSYRQHLKIHHTATHILHSVLQDLLGKHVTQKGSLVANDKLRFDISQPTALTKSEIRAVENKVNQIIIDNFKVCTDLMPFDQAVASGAMALFGEKYDDEVRVVSFGEAVVNNKPYSFELCGGTHVKRTGEIGVFRIVSESAIAAGIRRIEAVCGKFALQQINENDELLEQILFKFKSTKLELLPKIDHLLLSNKNLEKKIEQWQIDKLISLTESIIDAAPKINAARLVYKQIAGDFNPKVVRLSLERIAKKHDDLVLVIAYQANEKLSICVAASKLISDKYHAGNIAQTLAKFIGGSGGGQATLAQAGGNDVKQLDNLEQKTKEVVAAIII
ncbi:MAG: alanine--tRNA ligase [Rickettsiaceae bacterium]